MKKQTIRDRVEKLLKGRKKPLTPTEIGMNLGYEKNKAAGAVRGAIHQLDVLNYLIIDEDPNDRRRKLITWAE